MLNASYNIPLMSTEINDEELNSCNDSSNDKAKWKLY